MQNNKCCLYSNNPTMHMNLKHGTDVSCAIEFNLAKVFNLIKFN